MNMFLGRELVLMDEPTAALGVAETAKVEQIVRALRARSLAILIVSHNLDQVFRVADRVRVLRRGAQVGWQRVAETTGGEIISMITGLTKAFLARVPLGRWGRMEEIGALALFLASEEAGYITGTDILIDGGWCAQ